MTKDVNEHEGKKSKPAPWHPWRNAVPSKVAAWAKDSSGGKKVNNWKVGGGGKPWNG